MKNDTDHTCGFRTVMLTFTTTSLIFVSVALWGFVSGKVELAPVDPYEVIARAGK